MGQSKLKLSGNGNKCKPLPRATRSASASPPAAFPAGASPPLAPLSAYSVTGNQRPPSSDMVYASEKNSLMITSPLRISWSTTL